MRIFALPILVLLFLSCKNESSQKDSAETQGVTFAESNPAQLSGQWINIDFCSRSKQYGSVLDAQKNAHKPFAYAYEFLPAVPDSVQCFNGEKVFALPVKINRDTVEVIGASNGKSIYMVFNSAGEKDITVFDATGDQVKMDRYIKSRAESVNSYGAFATALNHNLFNGYMQQAGSRDTIRFMPSGGIANWKTFDRYRVCMGGACFVAGNDADIITLFNSKKEGSETPYAFRFSNRHDSLYLYPITMPNEGPAKVGAKPAYTMAYKAAQ